MEYKKLKSNKENFFEGTFLLLNNKYSDGRVFFLGGWNSKTFSDIDKQPIKFVQDNLGNLVKDTDLSKFIL